MVHRVPGRLDAREPGPEGGSDPEREGHTLVRQRSDAQLVADHRKLREGRVDEPVLRIRFLDEDPRERHEREEQGEQREEPVVGDEGGQFAGSILAELLDDRQRERDEGLPALYVVGASNDALDHFHGGAVPAPPSPSNEYPRLGVLGTPAVVQLIFWPEGWPSR
jgi:hypothetical protein